MKTRLQASRASRAGDARQQDFCFSHARVNPQHHMTEVRGVGCQRTHETPAVLEDKLSHRQAVRKTLVAAVPEMKDAVDIHDELRAGLAVVR